VKRIIAKPISKLTKIEYSACRKANYGATGYMYNDLATARERGEGTAIMIWDGPRDSTKNLLGWALVHPTRYDSSASRYVRRVAPNTAQYWVKSKYRRKGLATRLADRVEKDFGKVYVYPHSKQSGGLFAKKRGSVVASSYSRYWINSHKRNNS
jgi:hypothetical protein